MLKYFRTLCALMIFGCQAAEPGDSVKNPIRYVAIGDSYTIGEGVQESERWPNVLTRNLQASGIPVELTANPSRTGWKTRDALEKEMPVFRSTRPDFATLLIGVNDWVRDIPLEQFRINLGQLMDQMLDVLPAKERLIIITIPDFSATPVGPRYAFGRDISAGIQAFNEIIRSEAQKRNLALVDIFELSQAAKNDPQLVAADRLHPSAKAYRQWERLIFPVALKALQNDTHNSQ